MTSEENALLQQHWEDLIQSLDVGPKQAKEMEQLPPNQRYHLVESYVSSNPKCSAFYCVAQIKGLRIGRKTLTRNSSRFDGHKAKTVLKATEVSLRTNHIGWVYEFLELNGLDVLVEYVSNVICLLLRAWSPHKTRRRKLTTASLNQSSLSLDKIPSLNEVSMDSVSGLHSQSDRRQSLLRSLWCPSSAGTHDQNEQVSFCQSSQLHRLPDSLLDSLHQAVRCFRALLNNERGCSMALHHPRVLDVLAMCLIHPNFQTKTLVLELLTAVCLIFTGHERVIQAFNYVKSHLNERNRFETLYHWFRTYDGDNTDPPNTEFLVICVRFFNIFVHSTSDIMLRVYLQEEMKHLGLMEHMERLLPGAPERLAQQIAAYTSNEVDVAALLEDSQIRAACQQECEQLKTDVLDLQTRLGNLQVEHTAQTTELRTALNASQLRCSELERRAEERTQPSDREKALEDRVKELEHALSRSPSEANTENSVPLSSIPIPPPPFIPPPPPPPVSGSMAPPPPPSLTSVPPPPGLGQLPSGVEGVPIRPPIQTRYKLPLFNWSVLPSRQLRGTIFMGMNDEEVCNHIDMERFEELFKLTNQTLACVNRDTQSDSVDSTRLVKKPEKKSLVDSNRHRCFGILLRYLESEKYSPERLWTDITLLQANQDVADRIYHQLPTQDEKKLYLKYEFTDHLDVNQLTDADRLLLHLCKIERIKPRLELVLFMNSLEDTIGNLYPRITAVKSASLTLNMSERFRAVLELILAFGNHMNSSRRGIVYGFRLQSLDMLMDTKSLDRSWTLLHFLVDTIASTFPPLLTFYEDLENVATAAKVPMEVMTEDVAALVSGLSLAEEEAIIYGPNDIPARLKDFIYTNKPRVESIRHLAEEAKSTYMETVEYFGELQSKPGPEKLFGLIARFIDNFKKAVQDNEKRQQAEVAKMQQLAVEPPSRGSTIASGQSKRPRNRQLAYEARMASRYPSNRTRQITDGLMDKILDGLNSEPLQAEVHPKRIRPSND